MSASGYSRTIVRIGDANVLGGRILTSPGPKTVIAEGKPVAVDGSKGSADAMCRCDPGCNIHCAFRWTARVAGSRKVFVGGKPVLAEGDVDTCGHQRAAGAGTVYAG